MSGTGELVQSQFLHSNQAPNSVGFTQRDSLEMVCECAQQQGIASSVMLFVGHVWRTAASCTLLPGSNLHGHHIRNPALLPLFFMIRDHHSKITSLVPDKTTAARCQHKGSHRELSRWLCAPTKYTACASDPSHAAGEDAGQAQLQLLLAELKRIEGQQQQLKSAAAENRVLIVHPVKGFNLDEEDEYAEEVVVKPDPDKFIPSGQPPQCSWFDDALLLLLNDTLGFCSHSSYTGMLFSCGHRPEYGYHMLTLLALTFHQYLTLAAGS